MYKICLVCENGASTGLVVSKMRQAAESKGISCDINAYPYSQLSNIADSSDYILLGPQLSFKKNVFIKNFPQIKDKIDVIAPVDFGMMNGEKILTDTLKKMKK